MNFNPVRKLKEFSELFYWKMKKRKEGLLTNHHYEYFFTDYFGLRPDFYRDKIVGDIGCGPRGSLEWAKQAKRRIGIDPLADKYLKLGGKQHDMDYVAAYSENLPFEDHYFDALSSFNSLNHVDSVAETSKEIDRTLKPGGYFLLIVDVIAIPTPTEPLTLKWDFINTYFPEYDIIIERRLKRIIGSKIYYNLRKGVPVEKNQRNGVLTALLRKNNG